MSSHWHYRAFSEAEHRTRIERAKAVLDSNRLAGCVCTSPELIYYFTGYEAYTHHAIGSQAMVLSVGDKDPILILRDGDLPQAEETLVVGDLRLFRLGAVGLGELVRNVAADLDLNDDAIGLDISGSTTSGALTLEIQKALGDRVYQDCWRLVGRLRTVLSEAEIDYVKEATVYANAGMDAFHDSIRVGMSEIELAAEIEYAMRRAGSDYPAVPTWLASGERAHCQHAMASSRRLRAGDLVHAEFSGVARRYQCVTMGSISLGAPNDRIVDMANGGSAAFEAGLSAARTGGRIGDMELAYRASLEGSGLGDCCPMRFGVGISAAYPPVWENQITIQYECEDVLEPGMVFYIHASMQSMIDRTGMLLGGSFLMTQDGPERLDKVPISLTVVDS